MFGATLGGLGFKYTKDAVKILTKLDEIQENGGDADDFTKAIAEFAFEKASGALVDKVKKDFPDMFDSKTLSGPVLEKMLDEASSQANSFFKKMMKPNTALLFTKQEKSGDCHYLYTGEIQANTNSEVPNHVGPILVLKVAMWCKKCPSSPPNALRHFIVRFNIPLELKKKNKAKGFFAGVKRLFVDEHLYYFEENIPATTIKLRANCCDGSYTESDDYNISFIPEDDPTLYAITSTGFEFDKSGDNSNFSFDPGIGLLKEVTPSTAIGASLNYVVSGSGFNSYKSRQNGLGGALFIQQKVPSVVNSPTVTPYARLTIPIQNLNFSATDSTGNLMPTGQNRSVGANLGVGVNVKLKRTELNIGFSLLEINSTKFKDPNQLNPQFGPATNNILTGFNATSVGFELIFPIK